MEIGSVNRPTSDDPFGTVASNRIGVRGIRATWNPPIMNTPPFGGCYSSQTPFAGTSPVTTANYFLTSDDSAPNYDDFVNNTPSSYSLLEILTNLDFLGTPRPSYGTGERDKGAHEVDG